MSVASADEPQTVPIDVRTACAAATPPSVHGDLFVRVVVALALAHQFTILTSDERIAASPG